MEEHLHARLADHLVHHELGHLGIGGGVRLARPPGYDGSLDRNVPFEQFVAHAAHDLHELAVLARVRADDQQHQAAGPQAAEVTVALDQRRLRAGARRRHRRGESRRAAAHDEHVGLLHDGQRALGLDNLAAGKQRGVARTIGDRAPACPRERRRFSAGRQVRRQ